MDPAPQFRDRRVLITGGLGFIGSNLAHRLVAEGAEVVIADALVLDQGGNRFNIDGLGRAVDVHVVDLRNTAAMDRLVDGRDYVFNLAGQVSHVDSMRDPFTDLESNCRAPLSLLEALRRTNPRAKVVFAGTRQVYGAPQSLPVTEQHLLQPVDVNGVHKMAGEWYHILYSRVYGIRAVSLRLTNTYGPRQLMKHNRQGFIAWFIRQAMDGETLLLFGDGLQRRDLNHVDDVVDAFLLAAASDTADGEIYNLGAPDSVSLAEIAELLIRICGRGDYRLVPFPPERARIYIGSFHADCSKIRRDLDWTPKVGLEEGLRDTVDFYLRHRDAYW